MYSDLIQEGHMVILKSGAADHVTVSVRVSSTGRCSFKKKNLSPRILIDKPYGSTFIFENKTWKLEESNTAATAMDEEITCGIDQIKDNRNVHNDRANQKVTLEEVMDMRREGVSGDSIIDTLIKNSSTYDEKTEFSKQKYLKRKEKKHKVSFTVFRPTARLVSEMYFIKTPPKICNLRPDSLARLLTWGNVMAGGRYIVHETCVGLVVGAMMERMAGHGQILNIHTDIDPILTAYRCFDFPPSHESSIFNLTLDAVPSVKFIGCNQTKLEDKSKEDSQDVTTNTNKSSEEVDDQLKTEIDAEKCQEECLPLKRKLDEADSSTSDCSMPKRECIIESNKEAMLNIGHVLGTETDDVTKSENSEVNINVKDAEISTTHDEEKDESNISKEEWNRILEKRAKVMERRTIRNKSSQAAIKLLERGGFDGLIMASRLYPTPIILKLMQFLAPSRPVVIYSQYKEPLVEVYQHLRDQGLAANFNISETWWRMYQVLESRTHPDMKMNMASGYLLTAVTVAH